MQTKKVSLVLFYAFGGEPSIFMGMSTASPRGYLPFKGYLSILKKFKGFRFFFNPVVKCIEMLIERWLIWLSISNL